MKRFIIIFVLIALISTPAAAIPTVTLTQHIGYFFPGGGEITINPSSEITWVLNYYGSKAKIGNSFQTFCMEIGEDFATLNPYNAKITDKSVSGGLVTGADPLSIGTAWLYNEFQNGSLAYYDYTFYDYAAVGDIEQVKSLILEDINVNTKSQNGMMALHWAASKGHRDIAELLIENGADFRTADENGVTPLHLACQRSNKDVAELLIDKGADINTKNNNGVTPLHLSARQSRTDTVELLIAKGADVNVKDRWVWSPLHYACWRNRKETVEFLLAKGADLNAREEEGKTPLAVAEEEGHTEIVELLKKHGAKE